MGEIVALGTPDLGDGYLALPEAQSGPGVVVCHSWWGRTPFFIELCERLAADGFVTIAPDLYDGLLATDIEHAERLARALPPDAPQRRLHAALDLLVRHESTSTSEVGVVGCSLGGAHAILLAALRPDEVRAVVTFYGTTDVNLDGTRADFLGHFVDDDEYEPEELVLALKEQVESAGRVAEFHTYPGAQHWFFEPNRPEAHDAVAADLAYRRTVAFLGARLG